jgi:hypothetical protein
MDLLRDSAAAVGRETFRRDLRPGNHRREVPAGTASAVGIR